MHFLVEHQTDDDVRFSLCETLSDSRVRQRRTWRRACSPTSASTASCACPEASVRGAGGLHTDGRYYYITGMRQTFEFRLAAGDRDCDPQGFVSNASYVVYFDVVFAALCREALGPYEGRLGASFDSSLTELQLRYLGLAELDQELKFEARVLQVGPSTVVTEIEATTAGRPVVSGRVRHEFLLDPASRARIAMPHYLRTGFTPYLHERLSAPESVTQLG